jgi:hypothetical protein
MKMAHAMKIAQKAPQRPTMSSTGQNVKAIMPKTRPAVNRMREYEKNVEDLASDQPTASTP